MRRISFYCWLIALIVLIAFMLYPVRSTLTRTWIVGSVLAIYPLTIWLAARTCLLRLGLLIVPFLVILLICVWPSRPVSKADLRASYLTALRSFDGCRYVWGGETHLGVDCSGLPRAALIKALSHHGWRNLNPGLLRQAAWLWWHDASALEMESGYRGQMLKLGHTPNLHDDSQKVLANLQPGDLAIVGQGSHVLCYLGDQSWIEADPITLHVRIWDHPSQPTTSPEIFPWLDAPAELIRWQSLDVN